jgi:hypothetical protein
MLLTRLENIWWSRWLALQYRSYSFCRTEKKPREKNILPFIIFSKKVCELDRLNDILVIPFTLQAFSCGAEYLRFLKHLFFQRNMLSVNALANSYRSHPFYWANHQVSQNNTWGKEPFYKASLAWGFTKWKKDLLCFSDYLVAVLSFKCWNLDISKLVVFPHNFFNRLLIGIEWYMLRYLTYLLEMVQARVISMLLCVTALEW